MDTELAIYFDMDGVLAVFDEGASQDQPFNVPGGHYFLACDPDPRAVGLMRRLSGRPGVKVEILSRIHDEPVMEAEWTEDKKAWVRGMLGPGVPVSILVNTDRDKSSRLPPDLAPMELRRHVLVDDDPEILSAWRAAGGTAVQYLQPGRSVSRWNGPVILPEMGMDAAEDVVTGAVGNLDAY